MTENKIKGVKMKKIVLFFAVVMLIVTSSAAYGADKVLLGNGNIALKASYLNFVENAFEDLDNDDCLYLGLEAYNKITPNLYVGMEIGYAQAEGSARLTIGGGSVNADTELKFIPIELNLKYALDITPRMVLDFGAGASYNWMKEEISGPGISSPGEDWLWGGQIFAALNFKMERLFMGVNAKYQFTESFKIEDFDTDVNANNWRIGGQVGIMF